VPDIKYITWQELFEFDPSVSIDFQTEQIQIFEGIQNTTEGQRLFNAGFNSSAHNSTGSFLKTLVTNKTASGSLSDAIKDSPNHYTNGEEITDGVFERGELNLALGAYEGFILEESPGVKAVDPVTGGDVFVRGSATGILFHELSHWALDGYFAGSTRADEEVLAAQLTNTFRAKYGVDGGAQRYRESTNEDLLVKAFYDDSDFLQDIIDGADLSAVTEVRNVERYVRSPEDGATFFSLMDSLTNVQDQTAFAEAILSSATDTQRQILIERDANIRQIGSEIAFLTSDGTTIILQDHDGDGVYEWDRRISVVDGEIVVELADLPPITGTAIGEAFGSALGNYIAGDNVFAQVAIGAVSSTFFGSVGGTIEELLEGDDFSEAAEDRKSVV